MEENSRKHWQKALESCDIPVVYVHVRADRCLRAFLENQVEAD